MAIIDKATPAISNFQNRTNAEKAAQLRKIALRRNDRVRKKEIEEISEKDVKIKIPESIKEFSRIKKAVELAPDIDNSEKIASLKARIANKTYNVDYEKIADKILEQEF